MSAASPHLQRIKRLFEGQGITQETQITSHVAVLLLMREQWESLLRQLTDFSQDRFDRQFFLSEDLLNIFPEQFWDRFNALLRSRTASGLIQQVIGELQQCLPDTTSANIAADFFQREVRFELLKQPLAYGAYPTPHHLASFMAQLAVRSSDVPTIFDPAAGTGGLLAAAFQYAPNAQVTGCEYDTNIAALGIANLALHTNHRFNFYIESTFYRVEQFARQFDSVIVNPPFGIAGALVDPYVLPNELKQYGRNTHTLLGGLALHSLKFGGQAVFLLPTGALSGRSSEERLRRELLRNNLEAVITLAKDLFQPYSNVAAHLIVVSKQSVNKPVWFGNIVRDGYPTGAGRDLTATPDINTNELPRMGELVLHAQEATWDISLLLKNNLRIEATLLHPADGLPGVAVYARDSGQPLEWHIIALPSGALVQVLDPSTDRPNATSESILLGWLYLPYHNNQIHAIPSNQLTQIEWAEHISALVWSEHLVNLQEMVWQGNDADTELKLSRYKGQLQIEINRKRNVVQFRMDGNRGAFACLFSKQGVALSPWLRGQFVVNTNDFEERFAATPIIDGYQKRCGWLINISEGDQTNGDTSIDAAYLGIFLESSASLFHNSSTNEMFAFLPSGWLCVSSTGQLQVETGEVVPLRKEFLPLGFALGPAPVDVAASHTVFSVYIGREHLINAEGRVESFEPRWFLPEPPAPPIAPPSAIIARIRKNQTKMSQQVDSLLNLLGNAARNQVTEPFKPPLLYLLDEVQQQLWWTLQMLTPASGDEHAYFTLSELLELLRNSRLKDQNRVDEAVLEDVLRQQLDLFVRLGLIVRVHIGDRNVYRLASEQDIAPSQSGNLFP